MVHMKEIHSDFLDPVCLLHFSGIGAFTQVLHLIGKCSTIEAHPSDHEFMNPLFWSLGEIANNVCEAVTRCNKHSKC